MLKQQKVHINSLEEQIQELKMKENAAISKKQMESLGVSPNRSIGPNNNLNSFVNRNSFQGAIDNAIQNP